LRGGEAMITVKCTVTAKESLIEVFDGDIVVAHKRMIRRDRAGMTGDRKNKEVEANFIHAFGVDGGLEMLEVIDEIDLFGMAQFLNGNGL
jgi:hypothetical protein